MAQRRQGSFPTCEWYRSRSGPDSEKTAPDAVRIRRFRASAHRGLVADGSAKNTSGMSACFLLKPRGGFGGPPGPLDEDAQFTVEAYRSGWIRELILSEDAQVEHPHTLRTFQ